MLGIVGANRVRIVDVERVVEEAPTVKTIYFRDAACAGAVPGQFVMVWIPGVDEVPMSLSTIKPNGLASITVARVGEATEALHRLKPGDKIGVRGPFGRGFTITTGRCLVVGGGTGMAPLIPLTERLTKVGADVTLILGARTTGEVILLESAKKALGGRGRLIVTTEDGSRGVRGLATEPAEELLRRERFDMVYTCGREPMMLRVLEMAVKHGVPMEASLERYIKCGVGVCGSCCIGPYLVCRDGPVFTREQLLEVRGEFGVFRRDEAGRRVPV